jgi:ribose-phosphate pyrophosphokinase
MLLFAPNHSVAFARVVAELLGHPLSPSEEREFDGGEHKMRPLADVQGRNVCVIQSTCGDAQASANDKLCRLLFFVGALKDAVAAMFEAAGIDRVVVLDVHNEAAFDNAFRCPTVRLEAAEVFATALAADLHSKAVVVASPDVGGVKRAQRMREVLARQLGRDIDFAFVEKPRALGIVSGHAIVGQVEGREVILYDDMIATGTTILRAAQAARRAGAAHVYVAAPHAAFLPGAMQILDKDGPDALLVSDSIALAPAFASQVGNRLRICSVAPLIARTITELFRPDADD